MPTLLLQPARGISSVSSWQWKAVIGPGGLRLATLANCEQYQECGCEPYYATERRAWRYQTPYLNASNDENALHM